MSSALLASLQHCHERARACIAGMNDADLRRQFHPDLSPAGWHMGHMAVIEAYWVQERLANSTISRELKEFYFPKRSPKALRSTGLPDNNILFALIDTLHTRSLETLSRALARRHRHALLRDDYLLHFLIQHHSQHLETLHQILQQQHLGANRHRRSVTPLRPCQPRPWLLDFPAQCVMQGHEGGAEAYDNELPRHDVRLRPFAISEQPVTNSEYLGFMMDGGYGERHYWSETGWQWLQTARVEAPDGWWRNEDGHWQTVSAAGGVDLPSDAAVIGISYYEAEAYARYAGGRLPLEAEWEWARKTGAIGEETLQAWEWCRQPFHPYPGFRPFPYRGYSVPWFDGRHYTLRGGSPYTAPCVKRPTFRNFYTADKRHVFAGLRVAADRA